MLREAAPGLLWKCLMWKRLSDWLYRVSTSWITLGAVIIFVLFTAVVLPAQSARGPASDAEIGSPDTSFFYSPDDLYRMADAYGQAGRSAYIRARFTFDVVWPLVYLLFLGATISWVYGRAFDPGSWQRRANLAPVLGVLFDYLENLTTSLVMWRYPAPTPLVDILAPIFTALKWVFVGGSFVLLFIGIILGFWRWLQRKTTAAHNP